MSTARKFISAISHEPIAIVALPEWQWPFGDQFCTDAENGLVWLPEAGMGYLCVREQPYDAAYFAKYEGYAATAQGARITKARVDLVARYDDGTGSVVDVGIGCGDFVSAYGCHGYDINPVGVAWLNHRGLFLDPYEKTVNILTFWDALEHIPDVARMIASVRSFVFCSLPIFTDAAHVLRSRHFRRDEHCWYFTRAGLIRWMAAQGFECIEVCAPESLLGREDIETFAFRRVSKAGHNGNS